ncbi:MAG: hypothetical protein ACRDKZ_00510 [Actinomycetota bacterium]
MGEPACWMEMTCIGCGLFVGELDERPERCPRCGSSLVIEENLVAPEGDATGSS